MDFGMYKVEDPSQKALSSMQAASSTTAHMQRAVPQPKKPGKSVGGALGGAMGGAATGAAIGSVVPGLGTAVGGIGGAVVGTAAYLFS